MKSFLVILKNKSPVPLPATLLVKHVKHLQKLHHSGHLLLCGPFASEPGAVMILQADSIKEAEIMMKKDPFIKEKYYAAYNLTEFCPANPSNHWLLNSN
ncbi:MAG: hypothetical protein A3E87_08985 [Gammaproteobacteria bacterium RIFCSPHIGHO2_12_FULL_35_23]|nr:MAG: hypothetical protein A3E87_08985 [Gammaproteobacteria bacterium RIFCSPHIGHO2_12_FULL_35_23]